LHGIPREKQLLGFTAEEPGDVLLQGKRLRWLPSPWGALGEPWGRGSGTDTKQGVQSSLAELTDLVMVQRWLSGPKGSIWCQLLLPALPTQGMEQPAGI